LKSLKSAEKRYGLFVKFNGDGSGAGTFFDRITGFLGCLSMRG
jgi:hypothetical protein